MIRAILIFAVLLLVCVPLLVIGGAAYGISRLFLKPACWLGNKLGGYATEEMP